ncbi:MAG: DNA topoisomerase I [Candidatus Bathyarchaeia archaeon]
MPLNGYSLIIAEKPDSAHRIAEALNDTNKRLAKRAPFFEIENSGKKLIVVPASGHLYTLTNELGGRNFYPVFNFKWVPKHEVKRGQTRSREIIRMIGKLSKQANEFISATDFDIEGSLIGYTILKYACNGKENQAKRMKFSTLTREELNLAYRNLMPALDIDLAEAGRTRHEVDWLYGVNLSRALTISALKNTRRYATLSMGRVQGPTLRLIVERESEIKCFVPTPFWIIDAEAEIGGNRFPVNFEKEAFEIKDEATSIQDRCLGKTGHVVDVDESENKRTAPEPFDLGTMQNEAYRFFRFTPKKTLDIAEHLYLDALISYPRTSSQMLPPTIDYRNVLAGVRKFSKYKQLSEMLLALQDLRPIQGKKEDPAHPAIYPTGRVADTLSTDETKIYDLIVRRFMAAFGKPAIRISTKIRIKCEGLNFFLHGRRILEEGWMIFYKPYIDSGELILPRITVGVEAMLKKIDILTKYTEPPPRYNPASLLRAMEDYNIGTKATRADIIDTLHERDYLRGEKMFATDIGSSVIETLSRYCPEITSIEFTRNLEQHMKKVESKAEKRENILEEFIQKLKPVLSQLKLRESEVGSDLAETMRVESMRQRTIGPCPECGTGNLIILRSRRTCKQFIGCTNFFKELCKKSLPLPQKAFVIPTRKTCKRCGYPTVLLRRLNRKFSLSCINTDCPSKTEKLSTFQRHLVKATA